MGSLLGHSIPGAFIVTIGIWWTCHVFLRYYKALLRRPDSYTNTFSFVGEKWIPFDMYFICFAGIIGITVDLLANMPHIQMQNIYHITMYVLFEFSAIARILQLRKWKLPKKLEYALFALAFGIQGMLFYCHTHGRSQLDVTLHLFLCYSDVLIVASTLLEMAQPQSILPALSKCLFIIVNGLWYFQLGLTLYPLSGEPFDGDNPTEIMMVPVYFAWNIIFTILGMTLIGIWQYNKVMDFQHVRAVELQLLPSYSDAKEISVIVEE
ncbi:unnamed protein product [Allacma fusca]|uniref:Transmembrane protein 45B n=1 Tax=Allacma fusca TaxID=39272 RepID=A0A8J2KAA8_9HEXA|nr:unnamed protein product [Allacma fusca]